MTDFDWTATSNRLAALREEIEAELPETEAEPAKEQTEVKESLSATQLAALAEMLDVDPEELLQADEETIAEAMEYLGYKVLNAQYGRSGLTGKYPWSRNEGQVGYSLQHASPTSCSPPGESTAKPPKSSSSPMAQKGKPHRMS